MIIRTLKFLSLVATGILLVAFGGALTAESQEEEYCFEETGYCISGRIREYWEQNDGLRVFGLPISAQGEEMIEGQTYEVQHLERNRLELHPENDPPYDVLIGRVGAERLEQLGHDIAAMPRSEPRDPQEGCVYFEETGHNVCGRILEVWQTHGLELDGVESTSESESLALFGLPLTELVTATLGIDEVVYEVQWFERARLELHPENDPPYDVLPGLLNRELLEAQHNLACVDIPNSVNATVRPGNCTMQGERLLVDVTGFPPGTRLNFWFQSPDGTIIMAVEELIVSSTGEARDIPIETSVLEPGLWIMVFEEHNSANDAETNPENRAIVHFKVL